MRPPSDFQRLPARLNPTPHASAVRSSSVLKGRCSMAINLSAASRCSRAYWNSSQAQHVSYRELNTRGTNMTDPRHYSRWPDPWRREDDWGPITAAVMFLTLLIILAGMIVYGGAVHP